MHYILESIFSVCFNMFACEAVEDEGYILVVLFQFVLTELL